MHRPKLTVLALLAPAFMAIGLLVTACSSHPEQPILQQFFTASRLRDSQTLANFATVTFDPKTQGSVNSFSITSVSPVQTKPLTLKDLADTLAKAKVTDDAFTKQKLAYQNAHMDAIQRVLKAEAANKKVERRDEDVQKAWDKWRTDSEASTTKVSDAQQALGDASGIAELSINAARPTPVDVSMYNGTVASKEVTLSADVQLPSGQSATKTLVVTMERATLNGADNGQPVVGRWVITAVKPA
ncbi:MAG TPA: hypothetical protein VNE16_15110 [Vicinamibacterales bacterium]|nr:hypothetical protein [Vicinamibacterales bacterium]